VSPGADEVGTDVVLVVELVVDVVVVVLLLVEPPLSLPPHPTASTTIAPPSSAIVTLGSDFISYLLHARAAPDTPRRCCPKLTQCSGIMTARTLTVSLLPRES
jgi:hypothetical protein